MNSLPRWRRHHPRTWRTSEGTVVSTCTCGGCRIRPLGALGYNCTRSQAAFILLVCRRAGTTPRLVQP